MLTRTGITRLLFVIAIAALIVALGTACATPTPAPQPTQAPAQATSAPAQPAATQANAGGDDLAKEAEFYKGKTVDFIVPYSTGGGYDQWARVLAPVLPKYTGATFVVKNVPGAGSLVGSNQLYAAEPNGLTIGILNGSGVMQAQLTDAAGVKLDLAKFTWLGRIVTDQRVITVGTKSKFKTIESMRTSTDKVKFGAPGLGSSNFVESAIIIQALGIKNADIVLGYDTSEEVDLAVIRGDLDAAAGSYPSKLTQIKSGDLIPVLQYGRSKITDLPNVPLLTELSGVDDQGKQLIKVALALGELGRPLAAPPGLSASRAKFLEQAIQKALQDPDLLAAAKKQSLDIVYLSASDISKLVTEGVNLSPDQKSALKAVLAKYQPSK